MPCRIGHSPIANILIAIIHPASTAICKLQAFVVKHAHSSVFQGDSQVDQREICC